MTPEQHQKTIDEITESGRIYREKVYTSLCPRDDPSPHWRRIDKGFVVVGNLFFWSLMGPFILLMWLIGFAADLFTKKKETQ